MVNHFKIEKGMTVCPGRWIKHVAIPNALLFSDCVPCACPIWAEYICSSGRKSFPNLWDMSMEGGARGEFGVSLVEGKSLWDRTSLIHHHDCANRAITQLCAADILYFLILYLRLMIRIRSRGLKLCVRLEEFWWVD